MLAVRLASSDKQGIKLKVKAEAEVEVKAEKSSKRTEPQP